MTKEEAIAKVQAALAEAKENLSAEDYQAVLDSIKGNSEAAAG